MSSSVSAPLTEAEIQAAQQKADAISRVGAKAIHERQFVFFAAFDGTNNTKDDPAFSGDRQSTSVGQIWQQADGQKSANPNLRAEYYPGPGTAGTLTGSSWNDPRAPTFFIVATVSTLSSNRRRPKRVHATRCVSATTSPPISYGGAALATTWSSTSWARMTVSRYATGTAWIRRRSNGYRCPMSSFMSTGSSTC